MATHLMGPAAPRKGLDRHVIVTDPDVGPVSVRWYLGRAEPWRCRECGLLAEASCPHTFSAALLLAETLLGLTRAPELQHTDEGTPNDPRRPRHRGCPRQRR